MLQSPQFDLSGGLGEALQAGLDHVSVTVLLHQLAESLGNVIDAKDAHTLAHSEEVAVIAQSLALAMGLDSRQADIIHVAGHLHDIGKIAIPDRILGKPDPLTPQEWETMQGHPARGAAMLFPLVCLRESGVVDMVASHHERFDGRGYPNGLSGRRIPLGARVIAVADSLSAMLQARPYRPPLSFENATREILRGAGGQFDPDVAVAFSEIKDHIQDMIAGYRCVPLI